MPSPFNLPIVESKAFYEPHLLAQRFALMKKSEQRFAFVFDAIQEYAMADSYDIQDGLRLGQEILSLITKTGLRDHARFIALFMAAMSIEPVGNNNDLQDRLNLLRLRLGATNKEGG